MEYVKLAKSAKQKAKDSKDKEETPAPEGKKKAKEPKEQADILAPDVIANTPTLAAAKKAHEEAAKKIEEVRLAVTMAGAKPIKLYGNLLSDKARQPWEKIIKVQVTQAPWEDVFRIPHTKTPTKNWSLFFECVRFHFKCVSF